MNIKFSQISTLCRQQKIMSSEFPWWCVTFHMSYSCFLCQVPQMIRITLFRDFTHFAVELQPLSLAASKYRIVREFYNNSFLYHALMFSLAQSLCTLTVPNISVVWCQLVGEYLILPQKKLNKWNAGIQLPYFQTMYCLPFMHMEYDMRNIWFTESCINTGRKMPVTDHNSASVLL
jgi:hypothetical protein